MWSLDKQHHHHLQTCQKYKFSGPSQLNQKLWGSILGTFVLMNPPSDSGHAKFEICSGEDDSFFKIRSKLMQQIRAKVSASLAIHITQETSKK